MTDKDTAPVEEVTETVEAEDTQPLPTEDEVTENVVEDTSDSEDQISSEEESEDAEVLAERVIPSAQDYTLPDGIPRSVADFANGADMTQKQLDMTLGHFSQYVDGQRQAEQNVMLAEGTKLVESWGEESKNNRSLIKRALEYSDPEGDLSATLDDTGYGNHPVMLQYLLRMGNSLKEGGFITTEPTPPKAQQSAASAMFGKTHPAT